MSELLLLNHASDIHVSVRLDSSGALGRSVSSGRIVNSYDDDSDDLVDHAAESAEVLGSGRNGK